MLLRVWGQGSKKRSSYITYASSTHDNTKMLVHVAEKVRRRQLRGLLGAVLAASKATRTACPPNFQINQATALSRQAAALCPQMPGKRSAASLVTRHLGVLKSVRKRELVVVMTD